MKEQAITHTKKYIDSWLRFQYERNEIPGFAVAICHKGNIVFNEAYGLANLENKTKLTTDHIFRIASHSKTFTATALMQLQEQGKLRIDDYIADHLTWLKDHKDTRWSKVTVRQLMSHGAGILRDGANADYWQLDISFPDDQELKKIVLEAELVIDNNTKLKYSNIGYSLLGLLVEQVSGLSYNEYVAKHIVEVLGLENTGPEYVEDINEQLVTGYTRRDIDKTRLPIANIDTKSMAAATGFYSTTSDICNYFAAHKVGSGKLLEDESKKEMQRVQYRGKTPGNENSVDYGLGFEIDYIGDRTAYAHGGGFPGQITRTYGFTDSDLVIAVFTNCIDGSAGSIAKGILNVLDYFEENLPEDKSEHDMTKLQGRFMNLWGICDIIVTGDKVVSADPESWQPFCNPEELEYVDDLTLKVAKTSSFHSDSELVHFTLNDDGAVKSINYTGYTMWPEKVWMEMQAGKKIVE